MSSALSTGLSVLGLSNNLSSRVEISIECRNLPCLDVMSKSDPMVVLFLKENTTGRWQEIGRTEMIRDNENPSFQRRLMMEYYFEEMQELRFDVLDVDKDPNARDLSGNDYVGSLTAPLSTLIAANHRARNLMNRSNQATMNKGKPSQIIIHCEEIKANSLSLHLKISGKKLDKKDLFGKSDPYCQIFKQRLDGSSSVSASSSWQLEYQTETIMKTLDPNWKEVILPLSSLCGGDLTRPLLFKVFDYDSPTSSDRIGEFDTCVAELLGGLPAESYARFLPNYQKQIEKAAKYNAPVRQFTLRKPDKKDHKDRERSRGTIMIDKALLVLEPTFLDFIQGGMQVNLMVAVDFTGSNGHPRDHGSLHFIGPTMNQYQQAISSVGSILAPYDSDQRFPIYGFGGSIRGTVSHCFPLTFDPNNPEVFGVEGLLSAYSHAINQIELSGPTYFTPMIDAAAAIASSRPFTANSQSYHILLLLTDGVFNDMESTIEALVNASDKPLSIIIVGVGNADFSAMKVLDGDEKPLEANGKRIRRDIVQFVAFRDFASKHISALTKETLAEIPKQVLEFAKLYGIGPMTPPTPAYYAPPPPAAAAAAAPPSPSAPIAI